MNDDWKDYLDNRLIKKTPEGVYVIVPKAFAKSIPLSCPVCNYLLRTQNDEEMINKFNCCGFCAVRWAYPNIHKWEQGWRPTKDDIEESEKDRLPIITVFDAD